jgi:hypothetical protein
LRPRRGRGPTYHRRSELARGIAAAPAPTRLRKAPTVGRLLASIKGGSFMKAMFGVVSLLVALAIVGLIAVRQLKAVGAVGPAVTTDAGVPNVPQMAGSGTVRERAVQLQQRAADDVAKALSEGAAARRDATEK